MSEAKRYWKGNSCLSCQWKPIQSFM